MLLMLSGCLLFGVLIADRALLDEEMVRWVKGRYGESAAERMRAWQQLVGSQVDLDELGKLHAVNDFFNQLTYRSDLNIWGKHDYWATPLESLGKGEADCEDYSIAKYFTLREMGVEDSRLRIMYVKALELNEAHMVLTYYLEGEEVPLVLDNLNGEILRADQRADLEPVYSFNAEGLWLARSRLEQKRLGASTRLSLWQDLKARMASEMSTDHKVQGASWLE